VLLDEACFVARFGAAALPERVVEADFLPFAVFFVAVFATVIRFPFRATTCFSRPGTERNRSRSQKTGNNNVLWPSGQPDAAHAGNRRATMRRQAVSSALTRLMRALVYSELDKSFDYIWTSMKQAPLTLRKWCIGGGMLALILGGGCAGTPSSASHPAPPSPATTQASAPSSAPQSISYFRSGGIVGRGLGIVIDPRGHYQVLGGPANLVEGQLSSAEQAELRSLFEGWDQMSDNYPAPETVADVYQREIRYGPKSVTASDAAVNLPPRVRQVSQWLEALIARVPAPTASRSSGQSVAAEPHAAPTPMAP
jgi:hypothetical protein